MKKQKWIALAASILILSSVPSFAIEIEDKTLKPEFYSNLPDSGFHGPLLIDAVQNGYVVLDENKKYQSLYLYVGKEHVPKNVNPENIYKFTDIMDTCFPEGKLNVSGFYDEDDKQNKPMTGVHIFSETKNTTVIFNVGEIVIMPSSILGDGNQYIYIIEYKSNYDMLGPYTYVLDNFFFTKNKRMQGGFGDNENIYQTVTEIEYRGTPPSKDDHVKNILVDRNEMVQAYYGFLTGDHRFYPINREEIPKKENKTDTENVEKENNKDEEDNGAKKNEELKKEKREPGMILKLADIIFGLLILVVVTGKGKYQFKTKKQKWWTIVGTSIFWIIATLTIFF